MNDCRQYRRFTALLMATALIGGCGKHSGQNTADAAALAAAKTVVARVNGEAITRYDVERALIAMAGPAGAGNVSEAAREKLLRSLVVGRAMAQAAEKSLSGAERYYLDRDVTAYRAKLLAAQYLKAHDGVEPITEKMIQDYYKAHPGEFGGGVEKHYQMLFGSGAARTQRADVLDALNSAGRSSDWRAFQREKPSLAFHEGTSGDTFLNPRLRAALADLKGGETSNVVMVDDHPYRIRVTSETQRPARPLAEVRSDIRRTLSLLQTKKAIEALSAKVLKQTKVEYVND